jgi:phenylacetate-CoA ligase
MWVGGIPWVVALQRFGARGIPVGAEAGSIRILQYADICKPKAIIGTPSLFEHLIERAPEIIGKEVDKLGIKKLICMGGPGAGISQVRKRLIDAYNVREVYDTTGGGWGCASISCEGPEYRGMHVLTDDYFIWYDIIDPDTKKPLPIEDGTIGEGLLTSFEFEALPALKYKMGDLIQVFTKPCECGWPGYRFRILERVDDMLIVKGAKVYPIAVKNIVNSFIPRTTGEMRIVLTTPPPKIEPPVIVKVEYGKGLDSREISTLKEELEERIKGILRVRASIEPVPPGSLERVSFKGSLIERRYQKK